MRRTLHGPVGRTPRHACRNVREKNRRSDLPVLNIEQNVAKNWILHEPRHLKKISHIAHFHAQTSKCPRRFDEIDR